MREVKYVRMYPKGMRSALNKVKGKYRVKETGDNCFDSLVFVCFGSLPA